jgi:predicted nucleic-acid-binding Zn-ribbon protein
MSAMNKVLLANVMHLPELINGKVCVINNGNYRLIRIGKYTHKIEDNFDPMEYCIYTTKAGYDCIISSEPKDREGYLVNKGFRSLLGIYKPEVSYKVDDKIHLHSRHGIYTIVDIGKDFLVVTCKKWQYTDFPTLKVHKADFKCLAGGIKNAVFE